MSKSAPPPAPSPAFPTLITSGDPAPVTVPPVAPPWSRTWAVRFAMLLGVLTAGRLTVLATSPLDLSFDEAYYQLWSRQPDWCYFSKGPGIAVVVGASSAIAGETTFGVRLAAVVVNALMLTVAYAWAAGFFGDARRAFLFVVALAAAPVVAGGGLLATIDSPFLLCWVCATAAFWQAVSTGRIGWWVATGLAFAAGLQCKFTMAFFAVGMFAFAFTAERALLRTAGFWLALGIGVASLTPILIWNSGEGWITFAHTAQKGTTVADSARAGAAGDFLSKFAGWFTLAHLASSIGGQLAAASPILLLGLLSSFRFQVQDIRGVATRHPHEQLDGRRAWFLLCGGVPTLAFYTVLAFHRNVEANWTVAGLFTPLAAAVWYWARPWTGVQKWTYLSGVAFGFLIQMPILLGDLPYRAGLPALIERTGAKFPAKLDISNRVYGRADAARQLSQRAAEFRSRGGRTPFLVFQHYSHAAWQGFYGDPAYPAYVTPNESPENQFDIWMRRGRRPAKGSDALFVVEGDFQQVLSLEPFESMVQQADPVVILRHGVELRRFQVYECRGFRGFPFDPGGPQFRPPAVPPAIHDIRNDVDTNVPPG